MSTAELKKKLISRIKDTDDKAVLREVERILGSDTKKSKLYKLSDEQVRAVQEAREEIKRGKFLTNEEVDKEIDQWLSGDCFARPSLAMTT